MDFIGSTAGNRVYFLDAGESKMGVRLLRSRRGGARPEGSRRMPTPAQPAFPNWNEFQFKFAEIDQLRSFLILSKLESRLR